MAPLTCEVSKGLNKQRPEWRAANEDFHLLLYRKAQMPRTFRRMRTPAREAAYSRSIIV
jgi:DNA-binding GntR family transcriptional regulator